MCQFTTQRSTSFAIAISISLVAAADTAAQAPMGYGQYFQQHATNYGSGPPSTTRYLYDKYFYQRPTVSPYMNVFRPDTARGTSYQTFVRPELERRDASAAASSAYLQQRKLQGRIGDTRYPGAGFVGGTPRDAYLKPSQPIRSGSTGYYNHWYGGWNK
jgi:hypothetical protein